MDNFEKAFDLIKTYNRYKTKDDLSRLIKEVCEYFDFIKDKDISQAEMKFLIFIANKVGVPQYLDLLKEKFQKGKFRLKNLDQSTLSAYISESSLQISETTKLHRYQKQVLDNFREGEKNRFVLSAPTSFGKTFLVYEIIKKIKI